MPHIADRPTKYHWNARDAVDSFKLGRSDQPMLTLQVATKGPIQISQLQPSFRKDILAAQHPSDAARLTSGWRGCDRRDSAPAAVFRACGRTDVPLLGAESRLDLCRAVAAFEDE
eukprot:355053-Chlamydomonas_euryale.AAC.1